MKRSRSNALPLLLLTLITSCGDAAPGPIEVAGDTESDTGTGEGDDSGARPIPWQWKELPAGAGCGEGCWQLTRTDRVSEGEWDIWKDRLVYKGSDGRIRVVNASMGTDLELPDLHPDLPVAVGSSEAFSPTIHEERVYYALSVYGAEPPRQEMVVVDLAAETQELVWSREGSSSAGDRLPESLDAHEDRLVAAGGAGDPGSKSLSLFEPPWPSGGRVLVEGDYGGQNSLWGDAVVFWDARDEPTHIGGYDLVTDSFVALIDDLQHQYAPRIHKQRLVYMDFRQDEGDPWGSWYRAMVVMLDLETGERTRVRDGDYIAALPDIHGDVVVWMDYRECAKQRKGNLACVEIWGRDMAGGEEYQITELPGRPKSHPRIWGERLYVHFFDDDEGTDGIFLVSATAASDE